MINYHLDLGYVRYVIPAFRQIDNQYTNLLRQIMNFGQVVRDTPQGESARTLKRQVLNFIMDNGFPIMTERDLSGSNFRSALGELFAFMNGARYQHQLESYGCKWWKRWLTPEKCRKRDLEPGDMGLGAYGPAWTNFPTHEGVGFNQIENIVHQIQEKPELRTHVISPLIPPYFIRHSGHKSRTVVAPCHGLLFIHCYPENKELEVTHVQRSADVPVGLVFNIIQYAAFGLMLAKIVGYRFSILGCVLIDAHIYESQFEYVRQILEPKEGEEKRLSRKFATVTLKRKGAEKLTDFTVNDFELTDYESGSRMLIPTPV